MLRLADDRRLRLPTIAMLSLPVARQGAVAAHYRFGLQQECPRNSGNAKAVLKGPQLSGVHGARTWAASGVPGRGKASPWAMKKKRTRGLGKPRVHSGSRCVGLGGGTAAEKILLYWGRREQTCIPPDLRNYTPCSAAMSSQGSVYFFNERCQPLGNGPKRPGLCRSASSLWPLLPPPALSLGYGPSRRPV